ncbi:hypothetical protein [Alteromonas stellipolaris]|uniref:hypothetical protein n=1 Tax=Alteromonas stellipolaris TaxID=233316 RepID=UPI00273398BB|nr:hypothetical protein [Alteromonas stellipolaris]MDP2595470.1 hypothetical protein [Alteromonas stellipolaris]
MRKTKFDVYFEICQKLVAELSDLESKELQPLIDGFSDSIEKISVWVANNSFPAPKSVIATGLEQGVNELPMFFEEMKPSLREAAFQTYYSTLNEIVPNYQEKLSSRVQRIIKRGKIKSESEFYLLRNRLDQIEGSGVKDEFLISAILGQYEAEA